MKFFGMGGFEIVIILIVILIIFGPKNLPKLGNALGKTVSNLRSGMNEGKKKKEEADAEEAPEADGVEQQPAAEIEGEILVEEEEAPQQEPADDSLTDDASLASADVDDSADGSNVVEDAAADVEDATQAADDKAPAEPKKVRRVVKKKVS